MSLNTYASKSYVQWMYHLIKLLYNKKIFSSEVIKCNLLNSTLWSTTFLKRSDDAQFETFWPPQLCCATNKRWASVARNF